MSRGKDTWKKKAASADLGLAESQFHDLNVKFYEGFHTELITARLGVLCLAHESPDLIETRLRSGAGWGEVKVTVGPDEDYQETLRRSAELELMALRHHVGEVLLRVFWVHAHEAPCPWLALARLRDLQGAATSYLQGTLWKDESEKLRMHGQVIWGRHAVRSDGSFVEDRLMASAETAALWMAAAASTLQRASLFNAYKHGLAILPCPGGTMSLGPVNEPDNCISMTALEGFTYIELVRQQSDDWRWELVDEPVDYEVTVAEIAVFYNMLSSILHTGAVDRGVAKRRNMLVLAPETTPRGIADKLRGESGPMITRLAEVLAYNKRSTGADSG
jgi:hypothetical protein